VHQTFGIVLDWEIRRVGRPLGHWTAGEPTDA
jgi:hypothetical protein